MVTANDQMLCTELVHRSCTQNEQSSREHAREAGLALQAMGAGETQEGLRRLGCASGHEALWPVNACRCARAQKVGGVVWCKAVVALNVRPALVFVR